MSVDVLIIGAGIIGSALAESCALRGLSVMVLEQDIPAAGATSAGMGHLVVLDDNPAELALSRDGLQRWRARLPNLPDGVEYHACGTLWIARNAAEMDEAERKLVNYADQRIHSELIGAEKLRQLEPQLASGLAGALLVPGEAVIYPPAACAWLLNNAQTAGATFCRKARVVHISDDGDVQLADGSRLRANRIVVAAGCQSVQLIPGLPLVPRKGQLVITERYPNYIHHQLVELGYVQSAHKMHGDSVAFNVQPRKTGQLLIGSSRQFDDTSPEINWELLSSMLNRAFAYLPGLKELQGLRSWCGFRPATPDKLPLLGKAAGCERIWLATGHEGLGMTTALSSAALLTALMLDEPAEIDPTPYDPARFAEVTV